MYILLRIYYFVFEAGSFLGLSDTNFPVFFATLCAEYFHPEFFTEYVSKFMSFMRERASVDSVDVQINSLVRRVEEIKISKNNKVNL